MLDNEDMNVELDEMDIKQNLEDSRKPIEEEFNDDLYIEKIEDKIRTMEIDDYFQPEEDDQLNHKGEWKRHFGLYKSLLVINDDPIFVLNPYWYNNIIILTLLAVLMYATLHKQQTMIHYTITIVLSVLTTLSYIIGALLNPGLYSARKESTKFNEEFSCEVFQLIYKDLRMHCDLCDICIREWHHHSMLFGKCIGQGDLFYYYVFIVIIPIFGLNTLILYLK